MLADVRSALVIPVTYFNDVNVLVVFVIKFGCETPNSERVEGFVWLLTHQRSTSRRWKRCPGNRFVDAKNHHKDVKYDQIAVHCPPVCGSWQVSTESPKGEVELQRQGSFP